MSEERKSLPATQQTYDDGFADCAAESEDRLFRGTFIKFKDGSYLAGQDLTRVNGKHLVALSCTAAWIKWVDNKREATIQRQPGTSLPPREDLDEQDEAEWPMGLSGQPEDPWKNTRLCYLIDPLTAELYTFSNSSKTGRGSVIDLADQIMRMRWSHPQAAPIVELATQTIKTKFGPRQIPNFKVIGWRKTGLAAEEEKPRQIENKPEVNAYADAKARGGERSTTAEELEDEIPF